MSIRTEFQLMSYLKKHHKKIFPTFRDLKFNYPITGVFSGGTIGYADMFFKYRQRYFVTEIKYNENLSICNSNFWDSLKAIGYSKALSLTHTKHVSPMVMIHKSLFKKDIFPIIGKLKISYITFEHIENKLQFEIYV